jgi:hypothetical protein
VRLGSDLARAAAVVLPVAVEGNHDEEAALGD